MEAVYSTKVGKYVVSECSEVDGHYEVVRKLVEDTDEDAYKSRMSECVGLQVTKEGVLVGFMYAKPDGRYWLGTSIFSNDVLGLVCLMVEFTKQHGHAKIRYAPHLGMLTTMKSIVDGKSIQKYYAGNQYVEIRTSRLIEKFRMVFDKMRVVNE